jgi:hypothetical protein
MSPIEKIQAQFEALGLPLRPKGDGTGYTANCTNPDHPDLRPSMSITVVGQVGPYRWSGLGALGPDQAEKVLIHCFSRPCPLAAIVKGMGLAVADLWPDSLYKARRGRGGAGVAVRHRPAAATLDDDGEPDDETLARLWYECESARDALAERPEKRAELAARLGVSEEALEALGVGYRAVNFRKESPGGDWVDDGPAWCVPMVSAEGHVIGIQRRYEDPGLDKRCMKGGRLGLFVPDGWEVQPGPLFVPEGASDVAALFDLGLAAVGRPSNRAVAGARHLSDLLKADARAVVVLGENDHKADGGWPGDPRPFAEILARRLGRAVTTVVPPAGHKDVRAWRAAARDDAAVRAELLQRAERAAPVGPGPGRAATRPGNGFRILLPLRPAKGSAEGRTDRQGGVHD